MKTGIAQAGLPLPATRWPRSGADDGKLGASRFADANARWIPGAGAPSDRPGGRPRR